MQRGVNKVIIVGNAGGDPEVRHMPNGDAVVKLTVATSESWKDKSTGQQQERTEWHRLVFFKRLAEIVGEYVKKGSKIYVEGRLQTRSWEKDGVKQYTTEIVVNEMQLLDSRAESAGRDGGARPSENPAGGQGAGKPPQGGFDDIDSDIPFNRFLDGVQ